MPRDKRERRGRDPLVLAEQRAPLFKTSELLKLALNPRDDHQPAAAE